MKKKCLLPLLWSALLLPCVPSCLTPEPVAPIDGEWDIVAVALDSSLFDLRHLKDGVAPYLGFNTGASHLYGFGGDGVLLGELETGIFDDRSLGVSDLTSGTSSGSYAYLEQHIVHNLNRMDHFEVNGAAPDSLSLFDDGGRLLFKLVRRAPYVRVVGNWWAVRVRGHKLPEEHLPPTITFDIAHRDKMVYGVCGTCAYSGAFALGQDNDSLRFSELSYPEPIPGIEDTAIRFFDYLRRTVTYELHDGRLSLKDADGTVLVVLRHSREVEREQQQRRQQQQ